MSKCEEWNYYPHHPGKCSGSIVAVYIPCPQESGTHGSWSKKFVLYVNMLGES